MNKHLIIATLVFSNYVWAADQKQIQSKLAAATEQLQAGFCALPKEARYIGGCAAAGFVASKVVQKVASTQWLWVAGGAAVGAAACYKAQELKDFYDKVRIAYSMKGILPAMQELEVELRGKGFSQTDIESRLYVIKPEETPNAFAQLNANYEAMLASKAQNQQAPAASSVQPAGYSHVRFVHTAAAGAGAGAEGLGGSYISSGYAQYARTGQSTY